MTTSPFSGVTRIFGRDTKEAYDRLMSEPDPQPPQSPQPSILPVTHIRDPQNYLILEGRSYNAYSYPTILVAKARDLHNHTWEKTQEELHREQQFMLTPRQGVDLLLDLRAGNIHEATGRKLPQPEITNILNEIYEVRNPWRGEWYDASFAQQKKKWTITYHKITPQGLQQVTQPLEYCLMEDKTPGIDLEDWLQRATPQGLPPKNVKEGSLYYWHPQDNRVAGFCADSGGASFYCDRNPRGSNSARGVRRAFVKS